MPEMAQNSTGWLTSISKVTGWHARTEHKPCAVDGPADGMACEGPGRGRIAVSEKARKRDDNRRWQLALAPDSITGYYLVAGKAAQSTK